MNVHQQQNWRQLDDNIIKSYTHQCTCLVLNDSGTDLWMSMYTLDYPVVYFIFTLFMSLSVCVCAYVCVRVSACDNVDPN